MKIIIKFIFCGSLTAFLFPPFFILPLGFISFPFLFFLLIDEKIKKAKKIFHFSLGLFYGFGLNFILLIWIREPFLVEKTTSNLSLISYVLVIYCSIYYGLIFFLLSFIKNNFAKYLLIPVLFVCNELLIGFIGYGFPWITFAQIFSANSILLSLIYFFGTYGLSYFIISIFLLPITFFYIFLKKTDIFCYKLYFIISIVFILLTFFSYYFKSTEKDIIEKEISITIVQQNFSVAEKNNYKNTEKKIEDIYKIISQSNSDIIIFSENEYPYIVENIDVFNKISTTLKKNQSVILGAIKKIDNDFFNSLFLIEKNNILSFDKIILVPFGEFLPFRNFFYFLDNIVGKNDFISGSKSRKIYTSQNLSIIPIICYEIIFFNNLLDKKNLKSDLLVNITNDAWFGKFSGPYQHLYSSRMRAVEFNKPLIRVSNSGVSAIIDNNGQFIDYISLDKKSIKNTKINILESKSNLKKYHSLIFLLFLLVVFLSILKRKTND